MQRLGLAYDCLREINPDLVYCAISGFGQQGPLAGAFRTADVLVNVAANKQEQFEAFMREIGRRRASVNTPQPSSQRSASTRPRSGGRAMTDVEALEKEASDDWRTSIIDMAPGRIAPRRRAGRGDVHGKCVSGFGRRCPLSGRGGEGAKRPVPAGG